ncbi:hypothetical protein MIND_00721800 [Mycena indigotica]|uniref:Uncharacterized protein n=1 Tax=Mycena indigotica TaxID=2126181 RepID=A0A8H6W4K4_9AGAR|nr:uncharacterized protein MIND_00721800 [Mycena indigotica]KAF7301563.1 hypothetical protein MIND_00721800 [Mycena indigotica]
MPSTTPQAAPGHRHGRSHSRNNSISLQSLPTPISTTTHEPTTSASTQSLPPPPKRNSHHRRRSSVSTRRESADMMGVSIPDSAISPAEDPAERDSVRRNALWALEGKRDASFSKVEIPELVPFEFPTKPSFPPGSGAFAVKRDSFKPASKDSLHTLVEEEEEEDESEKSRAPPTPTTPTSLFMRNITARPRPPHLRPLSLTPDSLPLHNLPSPASPKRSSLKILALAPDAAVSPATTRPRPVLNLKLSPEAISPEEAVNRPTPLRKSSISYKTSTSNAAGLPTPESTPTCSERRFSTFTHSSISSRGSLGSNASSTRLEDDIISGSRPLSVSEQHFLFKSHNALLARITDLERALSFRSNRDSRPSSVASSLSVNSRSGSSDNEEPLDEMVSLVTDLKLERDELKRDVEGWRTRVSDMEKQLTVFTNRVEVERREAWVARTQLGLVEVERNSLSKRVSELEVTNDQLIQSQEDLKQTISQLLAEKENIATELQAAKSKVYPELDPLSTPRAFDGPVVPLRPVTLSMKRGLGLTSFDSASSFAEDEASLKLHCVEEEEDELAGYEDEDENDVLLSPSSSFGSLDDFNPSVETAPQAAPTHGAKLSISKWTFPKNVLPKSESQESDVDRFFGCLEDLDEPLSPDCPNYAEYDEQTSKGLFAKGFDVGDAKSCFVLPASVLASAEATFVLDSVEEEDETEAETVVEDGEVNNGIKITFTPPMDEITPATALSSPSPQPALVFTEEDEDDEESFTSFNQVSSFGRVPSTPPTLVSRYDSPSSIPRLVSKLPSSPPSPRAVSPLNSFVTPPTKRGGVMPSFIPQPSTPSRINTSSSFSTNASTKPSTTFIRQPPRQPLLPSRKAAQTNDDTTPHVRSRYTDESVAHQGSDMKSVDLSERNIPTGETSTASISPSTLASSIMSSPLAGRLSSLISWGMASSDATVHDSPPLASSAAPVKRGYVSKQSQLERLKSRLERETLQGSRGRKQEDEAIFL